MTAPPPLTEEQILQLAEMEEAYWGHRNHQITVGYWQLAESLADVVGVDDATWCSFATWSSRTLGFNIRPWRLDPGGRRLVRNVPYFLQGPLTWGLFKLRSAGDDRLAKQLATGNRWVFSQIGVATARFIEMFGDDADGDPARLDEFCRSLETIPLSPEEQPGRIPLDELIDGFRWYHRARYDADPRAKSQCVLAGNLQLGAYEQRRVDDWLTESFGAPILRPAAKVAGWVGGDGPPRWAMRFTEWWVGLLTRHALVIGGADEVLVLGKPLPPPPGARDLFAPPVAQIDHDAIGEIWQRHDRGNPIAAGNWLHLGDRMHYIANFFRSRQQHEAMRRPPFGPDGMVAVAAGGDPFAIEPVTDPPPTPEGFDDERLDALRQRTDPPADTIVARLLADDPTLAGDSLVRQLIVDGRESGDDDLGGNGLPDWVDTDQIARAQDLYRRWGPQINLALLFGSLPEAYCAADGARVLDGVSELVSNPLRRVAETTQLVMDMMDTGDRLEPGSQGFKSLQGVRLFHSVVRHLVAEEFPDWDHQAWGQPVNQEDLLGTLLTLSETVLRVLRKVGVPLEPGDAEAWLHTWSVAGVVLGIDEDLLPLEEEAAGELAAYIHYRHHRRSICGQRLANALLDDVGHRLPFGTRWAPAAFLRVSIGDVKADLLGTPSGGRGRIILENMLDLMRRVSWDDKFLRWVSGRAGRIMVEQFESTARSGRRPVFQVPESLVAEWRLRRGRRSRRAGRSTTGDHGG